MLRSKLSEGLPLKPGLNVPAEAAVSVELSHPHLVRGFRYAICTHPAKQGARRACSSSASCSLSSTALLETRPHLLLSRPPAEVLPCSRGVWSGACWPGLTIETPVSYSCYAGTAETEGCTDSDTACHAGHKAWNETWLVQEWCGRGTLTDAFLRGWLSQVLAACCA